MRLARYAFGGKEGFGLVRDGVIVPAPDAAWISEVLAAGPHEAARRLPRGRDIALSDVALLPPIMPGAKNFWVGANYRTLRDSRTDAPPSGEYPSLFRRVSNSLVGHQAALRRPRVSAQLDYEGEIVIVIGPGGRYIPHCSALEHIAGITIANDGTVRDWLHHSRVNVTPGKNFEGTGSLGPWIAMRDEADPRAPFELETQVNGELRQRDSSANLRFSFAALISYISQFTSLAPGDLISTGSPAGAGGGPFGFNPPRWLVPGDRLEISVSGVGMLVNSVRDEGSVDQPQAIV